MSIPDLYTAAITGFMAFLLLLKPIKTKSSWLLFAFVVALFAGDLVELLSFSEIQLFAMVSALVFLWGPLVYMHVISLMKLNKRVYPHMILPVIGGICAIFTFYFEGFNEYTQILLALLGALIFISLVYYSILMIMAYQQASWYRSQLNKSEYQWVMVLLMSFISFVLISFITLFLSDFIERNHVADIVESGIHATIISVLGWYGYKLGIIYPESSSKSNLSIEEIEKRERLFNRLEEWMNEEGPYLNPSLGIDEVASSLGVNKKYVSNAINFVYGNSFTSYINDQRIFLFKERMSDQKYHHLNIEAVAMECGFNSKSSFNRVFKAKEGITPSEYRMIKSTGS